MRSVSIVTLFVAFLGCAEESVFSGERSQGISAPERAGGPRVVYDVLAKPLPEIPLPNDQATRLDPTSPTGRRLNVSLDAPTEYERRARRDFDKLAGFGTYGPIMVSFDAPLDLKNLRERHTDNDFRNDAVYLVNVSPDCDRFGEEVGLDMDRGRFPIILFKRASLTFDPEAPDGYRTGGGNILFDFDVNEISNNILFPERNEPDTNGDGILQPEEDFDNDGVRDVANFEDPTACDAHSVESCVSQCEDNECFQACLIKRDQCIADNLMTHYERETNTLLLKPLWPLEQMCTYAVVLTKRLVGENGRPIESPFSGSNPRAQTKALKPLDDILGRYDLTTEDVGFAWTFTTGDMTGDIEAVRAGLYGHGPFAQLGEEFPADALSLWPLGELEESDRDGVVLPGSCGGAAISLYWNIGQGEWEGNLCALEADFAAAGGFLGGTFEAPYLLQDKDGIATEQYPADNDEVWDLNPDSGSIEYGRTEVTFWCSLPQEADDCEPGNPDSRPFCKPFPTVLYGHGYGSSRAELASHMGRHAAMGQALCGMDGPGHGGNWMQVHPDATASFMAGIGFFDLYNATALVTMLTRGRDRDLNNDGIPDPGGDMWTSDLFHTRDMVRQFIVEHMQFIRILRAMGQDGFEADFTGDGKQDIGGRHTTIGMWGISLGGVVSGVMAGAEPSLDTVSPNAGGAGLADIAIRSSQAGVPQAVILPIMGPLVAGCLPVNEHQRPLPAEEMTTQNCLRAGEDMEISGDTLSIGFMANNVARTARVKIGTLKGVSVGDRVVLSNPVNGESETAYVNARGFFRLGVAADALDAISRRPILGFTDGDTEPKVAEDPTVLGDRLVLTVFEGDSDTVRGVIDTWQADTDFQGTRYVKGTPLVAVHEGLGMPRNTPRFRRFMGLAQHGISKADPAIWGAHTFLDPLEFPYDPNGRTKGGETHVLMMPTAGDRNVPVSAGIAMGRVSGLLGSWMRDPTLPAEHGWREYFMPDPRYGMSPDEHLVDVHAIEGVGRLQRFSDNPINPNVIYDVDNVSDGKAFFSCGNSDWSGGNGENECPDAMRGSGPECSTDEDCTVDGGRCKYGQCERFAPMPRPETGGLRLNRDRGDGSFDAFRLPVLRPAGQHGIYNAQSFREFDADAYMVNFTARFLGSKGTEVGHVEGCDCSATQVPQFIVDGVANNPGLFLKDRDTRCTENDLKVCSAECANLWGMRTPETSVCQTE